MAIVRFEPFRELQDRMNRLFHESYRAQGAEDDWALGGTWAPAVDIYEQDNNIVLKAELPGVDPKDVDIRLENNTLTLSGERKFDNEVKKENYHRVERAYGAFLRNVRLPMAADGSKVTATFKNGVLVVTLPKTPASKGTMIPVKAE